MPHNVEEPIYLAKKNKVRCAWCGATYRTRAKYVAHFERKHIHG